MPVLEAKARIHMPYPSKNRWDRPEKGLHCLQHLSKGLINKTLLPERDLNHARTPLNLHSFSSFQVWFSFRQHNQRFSSLSSGSCLPPTPSSTSPLFTWLSPQPYYLLAHSMKGLSNLSISMSLCLSADSSHLPFPCLDSMNTHHHSPWSSHLALVLLIMPSQICIHVPGSAMGSHLFWPRSDPLLAVR